MDYLLGVIVLGLIMYAGKNRSKILKRESPLEILDRRFVNGEISKEEYLKQKETLNSNK